MLVEMGFQQHIARKRINGFNRGNMKHPIYVKTPSGNTKSDSVVLQPLVVHSEYKNRRASLEGSVYGVHPNWDNFFHNSNLYQFEKRINKGKSKIPYGVAVDFENRNALFSFIDWLANRPPLAKPPVGETEDLENAKDKLAEVPSTTRQMLIDARKGQGKYRTDLLEYWGDCAVSNIASAHFLRASHIKPWRDSNDIERIDKYNGLLLNPILDIAFDKGFISFSDGGQILISSQIRGHELDLSIYPELTLKKIAENHRSYLSWHRMNIFKE